MTHNLAIMAKGLLSDLERKSIEPIALRYVGPGKVRALQNFMSSPNAVDDEAMKMEYQRMLASEISMDGGMITADATDFVKKGKKSVGVARQYCGTRGKVDNCQSGVFAGYTSAIGYGIVDYRLYMPVSWMGAENKGRRDGCHVPEGLEFKTKVEQVLEMIHGIAQKGLFKAGWVGVDSFFGRNKAFLDGLPKGMLYFADILSNMVVYPILATEGGAGGPASMPAEASSIAGDKSVPWTPVILGESAKGPIITEEKCLRVYEARDEKPGDEVWLYMRRFTDGKIKYSLSDAPADAQIDDLRQAATMRWPIEQCFEECKDSLGMDHNETRSWTAWHRHILFVLVAQLFLLKTRLSLKKNASYIDAAPSA